MKLIYTLLLLHLTFAISAQTANVKGKLIDAETKQGIEFGTISFKNSLDSANILGGKSKEQGNFNIPNIPFGSYVVTYSSIGYSSKKVKSVVINQAEVDLGKIEIAPNKKNLKDVNIIGEKATVELGIDKKTFNVDKNITSAGGTAADILRNVPSVNVDLDGNLSLRGKENITLLVDGKPSSMFGNDPQTALNSIPAASIESVEVIT
ncbi:MAG: carboxypeptidase-like regulatory domain-containing protein, partial [Chitinophagaceae bacterium]|nr:carboxypeptidase-like regulatory domain-containing protein [Chitinophagaceae bacterium]